MKIFVTGGHGFIGREVVNQARAAGHEVLCLTSPWRMDNLPLEQLQQFRPEVVIHCAWVTTPGFYLESPDNALHRKWSVEMVKTLAALGAVRFVVLGTCAEYAASDANLHEERSIKAPVSLYGTEKHALHNCLEQMSKGMNYELVWLRLFYPYGPSEDPRRLITSMINGLRAGSPIRLLNPSAERDYIHVVDVASAVMHCASSDEGGVFNVGTGNGILLCELERLVRSYICKDAATVANSAIRSPSERVVADASKLMSLGWSPKYDCARGIKTYLHNGSAIS